MKNDLVETLDIALEKLRSGETVEEVLARFPAKADELRPLIAMAVILRELDPVEMPKQVEQIEDRKAFLAQVRATEIKAVSPPLVVRLNQWTSTIKGWFSPQTSKEKRTMAMIFVRAAVILTLVFASVGGTAALAADSLPDSTLYPAKMALERVQLRLAGDDPAQKASQNLEMARERVTEMIRMVDKGAEPGQSVTLKLEQHLKAALQGAAQLDDEGMSRILNQAQEMIQEQLENLSRVRARVQEPCTSVCEAIQLMVQAQVRVQDGLEDGNTFRLRFQYGLDLSEELPPFGEGSGEGNPYGQEEEKGNAGSGAPDGNLDCSECEPGGELYQYQYGQEPVEPGSDNQYQNNFGQYCDCCERLGDAYQYGQGPDEPGAGPGEPGGNPDCPDCEPDDDEYKYGQQADQGQNGSGGNEQNQQNQNSPSGSDDSGGSGGSGSPGGSGSKP